MARATKQSKQGRKQYSAEYKTEALALAARVRVAAAAQQLGLHETQPYAWRSKLKATTCAKHNRPVAPNRLQQDFSAQTVKQKRGDPGP